MGELSRFFLRIWHYFQKISHKINFNVIKKYINFKLKTLTPKRIIMAEVETPKASFFDDEFKARVRSIFKDDAEKVIESIQYYAEVIDKHERLLLLYLQLPLGPVLLYEWVKRVDNETLRNEWIQKNFGEKDTVLSKLYSEITKAVYQSNRNNPKVS